MFEFISKLSFGRGLSIGLIIFGNLIAPYWFLFQFAPQVYNENSLTQLVILSLAIGMPVTIMLYMIQDFSVILRLDHKERAVAHFSAFSGNSMITAFSFYVPCVLKFIGGAKTQTHAILWVLGVNMFMIISTAIANALTELSKKKGKQQANMEQEEKQAS